MMKRREGSKAAPSDLLVCFPSRAHLTYMPKAICSPSRPFSEPNKRHHHHQHNQHLKRLNTRTAAAAGPGSPLIWAKNNQISNGGAESSEPTSPKVTCAGQIKVVRPRSSSTTACRNWQSVMEEIERIHNRAKQKKKSSSSSSSSWADTFGFKKDVMNILTCLRNIRFDLRCFGSFPQQVLSSDDEDEDEDEDDILDEDEDTTIHQDVTQNQNSHDNSCSETENTAAVFSKWFMVLQEDGQAGNNGTDKFTTTQQQGNDDHDHSMPPAAPPPNALLLMRCRSAPAKSWIEEKQLQSSEDNKEECHNEENMIKDNYQEKAVQVNDENGKKETNKKRRETLAIVMKYDTDFYNLSSDISQETWVVGGFQDHFPRSTSWRR